MIKIKVIKTFFKRKNNGIKRWKIKDRTENHYIYKLEING
jgi:hypothetical protein